MNVRRRTRLDIATDHFLTYAELSDAVGGLVAAFPRWCEASSLGTTPEGRDLTLLTITDRATGPDRAKPGYAVIANQHACELAAATQAMRLAERLLAGERDGLLRDVAFYLVPRADPDGAEYALRTRGRIRSRIAAIDAVNALVPGDVDGDGLILSMRIRHPDGDMVPFAADPRIMVKRPPGSPAETSWFVYEEGLVHRFTGELPLRSGVRQVDFNRNWPMHWEPTAIAGRCPFSEPETRAIGEFLLDHPNVFAGIDLHCGSQAVFRPSSRHDRALEARDLELMEEIGRQAAAAMGVDLMVDGYRRAGDEAEPGFGGTSSDFAYFVLGISFYLVELGNGFNHAGIATADFLAAPPETQWGEYLSRVLRLHDERGTPIFHPWRRYAHPQLGEVEIGGVEEGNAYYMAPPLAAPRYETCADFVMAHARRHPALRLGDVRAQAAGGGCRRIVGTISNTGGLDVNVMRVSRGAYRFPVTIAVTGPDGAEAGAVELPELAAGERREFAVSVTGSGPWRVRASHPRAGAATAEADGD